MPPRLHVDLPLQSGLQLTLPAGAARHVQVLRLQPGDALTLFNGSGGEWDARVAQMGRRAVVVDVLAHAAVDRELPLELTLALGMPANERMDALVEKAAELGVAAIQPLVTERSVLRLAGERADKRRAHWEAVAVAACEQCGRTRVPRIEPVVRLADWLAALPADDSTRWLLAPGAGTPLHAQPVGLRVISLSGPEGGLTDAEQQLAIARGFAPVGLGPRVLRADTAPLALLAFVALRGGHAAGPSN
jgi:16S rRNA (uracil1498-N3)-methyltransferase